MRRWLIIGGVVLAAVATPVAVLAATGALGSSLDRQRAAWTTNAVSTTSPSWHPVPGLANIRICSANATEIALTLSANVRGAPVRFRVLQDGGPTLLPGPARFVPAAGGESFSYTFIGHGSTFEASDQHLLQVEWSSPSGGPVTLRLGDANVLFQQGAQC